MDVVSWPAPRKVRTWSLSVANVIWFIRRCYALVSLDDEGYDIFGVPCVRVWLMCAVYYMGCLRFDDLSRELQITVDAQREIFQEPEKASGALEKIEVWVEGQTICFEEWLLNCVESQC